MTRITSKSFSVEGIVIGKKNFFEADRILDILTREKGIIRAVVRGARKSKSKLSGTSELFTYGNFSLAKGKSIDVLTSSAPLDHFQKASNDLGDLSQLFLISETLTKLLPREVPNEEIFEETKEIFFLINRNDDERLAYEYLYKLAVILGYGLTLTTCPKCHNEIKVVKDTPLYIDFGLGGVLCENCLQGTYEKQSFSTTTVKLLRYIETHNIKEYSKVTFTKPVSKELQMIVSAYLNHIYQKELKSHRFINDIKALK